MLRYYIFKIADNNKYCDHRKLKKDVFVNEGGWKITTDEKSNDLVSTDEYDESSYFINMYNDSEIIGTARFTNLHESFPHRKYFPNELIADLENNIEYFWTINGLAVHAAQRKKVYVYNEGRTCIAHMLIDMMIESIGKNCGKVIWAISSNKSIENLLVRKKFRKIGRSWQDKTVGLMFSNYIFDAFNDA